MSGGVIAAILVANEIMRQEEERRRKARFDALEADAGPTQCDFPDGPVHIDGSGSVLTITNKCSGERFIYYLPTSWDLSTAKLAFSATPDGRITRATD